MELTWPNDEVNKGRSLKDQALIFLRHAAHDTDDLVWVVLLGLFQPAECAVDLVLGVLPDAARIE
jgi:hypothetical protein